MVSVGYIPCRFTLTLVYRERHGVASVSSEIKINKVCDLGIEPESLVLDSTATTNRTDR
jgi:hypothetical protein